MARGASHHDDEIPALGGARILHQVVNNLETVLARRFKTKGRCFTGQRKVVIDGFWNMTDANLTLGSLRDLTRGIHGIVAADRHQKSHCESFQRGDDTLEIRGVLRRVGARGGENRAAFEMYARDVVVIECLNAVGLPLHQVSKAVIDADYLVTAIARLEGYCADGAVDAGGRTAADDNSQPHFIL